MNEELIKHQIEIHEKRINNHSDKMDKQSDRIDKVERCQARTEVQIQNLVLSINSLTSTLKWFIGLSATGLVGYFFNSIVEIF